jgi:Fibronectin type III domain.
MANDTETKLHNDGANKRSSSPLIHQEYFMNTIYLVLIDMMRPVAGLRYCSTIFLLLFLCLGAVEATAKDYTFSWDANSEPVSGYRLYYKKGGTDISPSAPFNGIGAQYPSPIAIGKDVTSFTITGLDESATYHFALTAYNDNGESGYTQVVTMAPTPNIHSITIK